MEDCIELGLRGIAFERQRSIAVAYKGHDLGAGRLDLLVGGCLVLELKSVSALTQVDVAKVRSYLEASGCKLALLINFNVPMLRDGIRRLVRSSS